MNDNIEEPISLYHTAARHDGWTGEAMAKFLETLAETGIVIDACDEAGKSKQAAYALRRRDPLFARAWELALGNARDRLADTLLARSIEGNVEQIIKDGVIVAEKHYIDNRLALAILKRLDQMFPGEGRGPGQCVNVASQRLDSGLRRKTGEPDWDIAINALRTGKDDDIAAALALLQKVEGDEVDQVDPTLIDDGDAFDHPRIWREFETDEWRTNYPPPPDFTGFQQGDWEDETYCRAVTSDELAALIVGGIAEPEATGTMVSFEEDAAERDKFFIDLAARADAASIA